MGYMFPFGIYGDFGVLLEWSYLRDSSRVYFFYSYSDLSIILLYYFLLFSSFMWGSGSQLGKKGFLLHRAALRVGEFFTFVIFSPSHFRRS
ncbi:hypothetical protein L873DRAFT_328206 [Choiromyces venosus 120613-1]|uniref:Uncharacterized protein n=1 Tax=Choiromyces venosus 120613-1 TaxID=1336337 RepID=A0A3N4JXH3_9PEZI|nr:hypothetical protein L873DRAFT_328206 [Choiromyces venosus 120613-1]